MSSSDWIAGAQGAEQSMVPEWITALPTDSEFRDVSPFAITRDVADQSEPAVQPEPDSSQPNEFERGFAAGEAAGRAAEQAELASERDTRTALRLAFRELDQAAMDAVATELTETVMTLCEGVLGEYAADLDALKKRAYAAAQRLGSAVGSCTLYLNPDDVADLQEGALPGWLIEPDPSLERGSFVLSGEEGGVRDGPSDWRRAIAAALRG